MALIKSCLKDDSRNFFRSFRIKNSLFRTVLGSDQVTDLLGCNFSTQKTTMESINGFNEAFIRYWGEDGDVFIRLRNYGCKLVGKKSFACQYHLFHGRRDFSKEDELQYFELLQNTEYKWAKQGLISEVPTHLQENEMLSPGSIPESSV